jgi:hypothetical protein
MITLTPTKVLIVVVLVLISAIYFRYYSKYSHAYNITQTYLNKINLDLLYERNPIIIYDSIKTPRHLLKTLFKYSYVTNHEYIISQPHIYSSKSKFSFIYHTGEKIDHVFINLINPIYHTDIKEWRKDKQGVSFSKMSLNDTNIEFITVKLKPFQVLIIPSHWMLQVSSEEHVVKTDLNDMFSYFYFKWFA